MGRACCVDGVAPWRRPAFAFFFSFALVLFVSFSSQAQDALKGVALVIGNGDYQHLPKLANPDRDARAIEELLKERGFDTVTTSDRDARRLATSPLS
jgi:tRNA G18 (ribose-2'-O)-methylase SpoU